MKKVFILIVSALILGLFFTGCSNIAKITSPAGVNTDGDLYKCECFGGETATGVGHKIKSHGTWFMYNFYSGVHEHYEIQAGNPKNGSNIIGEYEIISLGGNMYRAEYYINTAFVVVDEHLGIDNYITTMDFKAKPGQDDNQDFGVPFYDEDGEFYIFAHFAVECAE
jgi:PKD repeat protein